MAWPRDDAKLDRVRALMGEQELDALVVRAPDNVLYLTNFWGMKGFDACVFPREGDPVLICLEPSADDAARNAWTEDVRLFGGYDPGDPRPPGLRALDLARAEVEAAGYARVGLELSLGTQATDRMVGEPTTFPKAWFDAFPDAADATPLLNEARAIKTAQEIERMRLANEIAAAAMEHVQGVLRPGMTERAGGGRVAGLRPRRGHRLERPGRARAAVLARLVGAGDQDLHRDRPRPGRRERADAVRDLGLRRRLLGRPHEEPLPRARSPPRYEELLEQLTAVYDDAVAFCTPGASLAELDRRIREGIAAAGYPGQPSHPICHGIGARAHEPPYAHQAGGGEIARGHGARDRARHVLARGRRPPPRGQLPDHGGRAREALALPGRRRCHLTAP